MKNKKILLGAVLATVIPVVSIVSCSSDNSKINESDKTVALPSDAEGLFEILSPRGVKAEDIVKLWDFSKHTGIDPIKLLRVDQTMSAFKSELVNYVSTIEGILKHETIYSYYNQRDGYSYSEKYIRVSFKSNGISLSTNSSSTPEGENMKATDQYLLEINHGIPDLRDRMTKIFDVHRQIAPILQSFYKLIKNKIESYKEIMKVYNDPNFKIDKWNISKHFDSFKRVEEEVQKEIDGIPSWSNYDNEKVKEYLSKN